MVRLILATNFLLLTFSSFSKVQCFRPGKIRYVSSGKHKVIEKNICVNHFRHKTISASCFDPNKECLAIEKYKGTGGTLLTGGEIGTPLDRKCYFLEGSPLLVEVFDGKGWFRDNLCFFEDDSFISVTNTIE